MFTDNGSNFLKTFHIYGAQDENDCVSELAADDAFSYEMGNEYEDVDVVEVDFAEVTTSFG